ncbi:DUF1697 domain-containing protein [Aureliella helgolandensis]|uniref:DUF1697 domain-containing protein n=1 Tax=Aureliella helgolandensis TaxID=2527968 RepID=A0A518G599_9BACT|nr:DUF1697 domain-containing protein [Aureliella helgolandensis]QDV23766.1 hypothetical protein Q31a_20710 [Aureliella helgolandensis]
MRTSIALLRGINMLGRNQLPMQELVEALETLKVKNISTYIQSGNAVFQSSRPLGVTFGERLAKLIEVRRGFKPYVLVADASIIEAAIAENPFVVAEESAKTLHVYFLSAPATRPDLAKMALIQQPSEQFHLTDRFLYLHTPEGFGKSKLAARIERLLGVPATARNWRTTHKLAELIRGC